MTYYISKEDLKEWKKISNMPKEKFDLAVLEILKENAENSGYLYDHQVLEAYKKSLGKKINMQNINANTKKFLIEFGVNEEIIENEYVNIGVEK